MYFFFTELLKVPLTELEQMYSTKDELQELTPYELERAVNIHPVVINKPKWQYSVNNWTISASLLRKLCRRSQLVTRMGTRFESRSRRTPYQPPLDRMSHQRTEKCPIGVGAMTSAGNSQKPGTLVLGSFLSLNRIAGQILPSTSIQSIFMHSCLHSQEQGLFLENYFCILCTGLPSLIVTSNVYDCAAMEIRKVSLRMDSMQIEIPFRFCFQLSTYSPQTVASFLPFNLRAYWQKNRAYIYVRHPLVRSMSIWKCVITWSLDCLIGWLGH